MVAIIKIFLLMMLCTSMAMAQSSKFSALQSSLKRLEAKRGESNKTISQLRSDYSTANKEQRASIAERISNLEEERLDITQQINEIEAKLAELNVTTPTTPTTKQYTSSLTIGSTEAVRADTIYRDQLERLVDLGLLRNRYNQSAGESEAMAIKELFDSLKSITTTYSEELAQIWSETYDDRIYAMNVMIEQINDDALRSQCQQITRDYRSKIDGMGEVADPSVATYEYQQRELIAIEMQLHRKLKLDTEPITARSKELSAAGMEGLIAPIEIEERIFIDYAPITFSNTSIYNKTNPIPATKIFKNGTVYRILYGGFTTLQQPTLFRGAKPLSVNKEDNLHRYYGGGYKSYKEAVEAQKASKARGFNRPEIVMWRDGKSRNLSRQPYPKGNYRVIIKREELPEELSQLVKRHNPSAQITRTGDGEYTIATFTDMMVAEDLIGEIEELYEVDEITIK